MLEVTEDETKARIDTREVNNYIRALQHGLRRVPELPVSIRLISEIHGVLMDGVAAGRGAHIRPGEFKTDQNWIGAKLIQNARFVPPPPAEAMNALGELEKYVHLKDDDLPLVVKLALLHYQFEAIHPFPDGNGRVGRLLVPLLLCEQKTMSQPLLYLSTYFEKHYEEYIDLMFNISTSGAWEPWIRFFLNGIEAAARSAIEKSHALQDLHRSYMAKIRKARSSALLAKVIDLLFNIPATTVPHSMKDMGISYNSAKNNLQKLVDLGILAPDKLRDERPLWFFAMEIIRVTNVE